MAAVALSAASSGCDAAARNSFERFIPSPEAARAGVSLAMEGWLKNLSPEASGSSNPQIHVVDQTRRPDQRLAGYEILGEASAENAREFTVRVRYDGADEPEIVRFVAVGVEPMWVFRREDYDTIWMHKEEAPADRAGDPAEKP